MATVSATPGVLSVSFICPAITGQYWVTECQVDSVLNAQSHLDVPLYYWDFGDSSTGFLYGTTTVGHVFSVPGNYTVRLTLWANSQIAHYESTVVVIGFPKLNLEVPMVISSEDNVSALTTSLLYRGSDIEVVWSVDGSNVSNYYVPG